jgi:O-antigen ligase
MAIRAQTLSDSKLLQRVADGLMIVTAVALPWSTSVVSVTIVLWLVCVMALVDWGAARKAVSSPVGGLPVLLLLLGIVGMAWANVSFYERWEGLTGFIKLLLIPVLIAEFARSAVANRVLQAFLLSCSVLLIASFIWWIFPWLPSGSGSAGVPVKNYIVQSIEFTVCAAALVEFALDERRRGAWFPCLVAGTAALAFLSSVFFVATGRTALVIIAALVILFGLRHAGWKGLLIAAALGSVAGGIIWFSSPYLRERVIGIYAETRAYEENNALTSSGERIAFWTNSLRFVESAPIFGHGTGSIRAQFERAVAGHAGARGQLSDNPHNQTLAVGIQLGLTGIVVLWAMWSVQFAHFWRPGFSAWLGLVIVTQNIVGSLFNSLIFNFTEGWLYVLGVGVAAGLCAQEPRYDPECEF